jgi:hypothetical protein
MCQYDLKGIISEAAKSDLHYMELVEKLQQGNLQQKIEDYKLGIDEILMYINIDLCTQFSGIENYDTEGNA